ncbi:MAG: hypothetical protein HY782_05140 [Chloroflexi bacterium]|nr:hypothetical protein [Chloroflexota bacterium]
MDKFSPLDLSAYFNATRENFPLAPGYAAPWHAGIEKDIRALPHGEQTFWGIPFSLAEESWLVLGAGTETTEINLASQPAPTYILFAHSCNSSYDPNVGTNWRGNINFVMRPGEHLADYILRYADGSEHRQPIRRRFEISEPTNGWGQLAFAARSHEQDRPLDWNGAHERGCWGANQTGVAQGYDLLSQRYWIYALPNPNPERPLAMLSLRSTGADTIAIAGITLYYGREHPLRYRRLETLRVTLPDQGAAHRVISRSGFGDEKSPIATTEISRSARNDSMAQQQFGQEELRADIDLGIVAGAYALTSFDPDKWLDAEPKGLGEAPTAPDQHMIDVTACPDATLRVGRHPVEMRDVYDSGNARSGDGQVHVEVLTPRKTWLQLVRGLRRRPASRLDRVRLREWQVSD